MPRAIWNGAISFGLVHVPVALFPATQDQGIDFDWLDKHSMDPVGYKRVNKRTGKEVANDDIVKGVKVDGGDYVVLSDDEIKAAFPRSTQTIEIETFVHANDIAFVLLERPYYLEPIGKGERVYTLLREAMREAGVIGIARVVMHNKEHLAALIALETGLMLNTLRWATEVRPPDDYNLPPSGRSANQLKPAEIKMAAQLIKDMTSAWKPDDFQDTFTNAIGKLIQQKTEAGQAQSIKPLEAANEDSSQSNVVDLTELLARSLEKRKAAAGAAKTKPESKSKPSPAAAPIDENPRNSPAPRRTGRRRA